MALWAGRYWIKFNNGRSVCFSRTSRGKKAVRVIATREEGLWKTTTAKTINCRCFSYYHHDTTIKNTSNSCCSSMTTTTTTSTRRTFATNNNNINNDINKNSNNNGNNTDDGLVVGVWVFCRHGDRTPARSLGPIHRANDEAAFWIDKLPTPDTRSAFDELSQLYPLDVQHNSHGTFLDVHRNPFGFLTQFGTNQMKQNGQRFYQRYSQLGYHRRRHLTSLQEPQPLKINPLNSSTTSSTTKSPNQFLIDWDVTAYSTNYLRTVLSVQSFLDGLLGTDVYDPMERPRRPKTTTTPTPPPPSRPTTTTTTHPAKQNPAMVTSSTNKPSPPSSINPSSSSPPTRDEMICASIEPQNQEPSVPNHHESRQEATQTTTKAKTIPVTVRDQTKDNLNAFDRNPDLMAQLVGEVMATEEFIEYETTIAPLAHRLVNILPGLGRKKSKRDFTRKTPSGINWVEAADHFVCRNAHNLSFTKFTDFEHDDRVEQTLRGISSQTLTHLSWRFRQWYKHPKLLAAITVPALREIIEGIQGISSLSPYDRHPFVLFSCHDVTLLALLYGLGADFLREDEWMGYWPSYASTLVLELVQIGSKHVVRILLNGEPIRSVHLFSSGGQKAAVPMGNGPRNMLLIDDFIKIVDDLEYAGRYDDQNWSSSSQ